MDHLLQLFGYFAICFAVASAAAYMVTVGVRRNRRPVVREGTMLRLRCAAGVYRCTLLEGGKAGWIISAPIQRDHFVPIRPGEMLTVEAADKSGVYRFRTQVLSRDADSHSLTIRRPEELLRSDRRERSRHTRVIPSNALIEGEHAKVVDLSEAGARIATRINLSRGERVRLDLEGRDEPVFGWVLETLPGSVLGYESCEVRLRFEQLLPQTYA